MVLMFFNYYLIYLLIGYGKFSLGILFYRYYIKKNVFFYVKYLNMLINSIFFRIRD